MTLLLFRLAFVISLKNWYKLQVLSAKCILDNLPSGPCAWHDTTACRDKKFFKNSRNHTLLGTPCKRWVDVANASELQKYFGTNKDKVGNNCQNPVGSAAPWCFMDGTLKLLYCYPDCKYKVPPCIDNGKQCARFGSESCKSSTFYDSSPRETVYGDPCLWWNSTDVTDIRIENFGSNWDRVENTCQNPDGEEAAPWCVSAINVDELLWNYCYAECPVPDPPTTTRPSDTTTQKNRTHPSTTRAVRTTQGRADISKDSQCSYCVSPLAVGLIVGGFIIVLAALLLVLLYLWKRLNDQMKQQSPTANKATIPSTKQSKMSADGTDIRSAATETTNIPTARTESTKPPERNLLAPAKMPPMRTERLSTMQEPTENYAPRN